MWQKRQVELFRDEIDTILSSLSISPGLFDLIKESLPQFNSPYSVECVDNKPWFLLPLIVCESFSGSYIKALPAATSIQLLRTAADIFDDIEDADSPTSLSSKYGSSIATNVGTTLIIMAEKTIANLVVKGVDYSTTIRVLEMINSYYLTACAGQHLDLHFSLETSISEDSYLSIVAMKSASTVECSCRVGALLAGANQKLTDTFGQFGQNLGIASQIADDILGITKKNDIIKCKVTLPVIYALSQTDSENHHQLEQAFHQSHTAAFEPDKIRGLLFSSGAIQYATIKMELYKQRAMDILSSIQEEVPRVEQLWQFLE
jgi:geranylgeranyl pyrophosphate synthase